MYKKMLAMLLCLLMVFSLIGCGGESKTETKTEENNEPKTLVIGSGQSWSTADVINSYDGWYYIRYGIGETLTKMNNDMSISGWLAEDGYTVSDDQTTWTFTLKDGIKFSNGNVCDAEAVKGSLMNAMENGERAAEFFGVKEIKADGLTLTIECSEPQPILPNKLADPYFTIVDTSVEYDNVTDNGYYGTGPFVLESYDVTSKTTIVKKNENYWNGDVALDEVQFLFSEDQSTLTMGLKNGSFNVLYNVSMNDIGEFEDNDNYTISRTASGRTTHGFMNQNGALGDEALRKAVLQLIDKETICANQLNGQYVVGKTLITSAADYGYDELTDPNPYSKENAAKLLDDAGYVDVDGDGFRETPDGKPLELNFKYYTGRPEQQIMVEVTQMEAAEIGLKITPVLHESATVMDELKAGDYDLLCMSINVLNCADPENHLKTYFAQGGSYSSTGWKNDRFEEILKELSVTADQESRRTLVKEAEQLLLDDSVAIYFCYPLMNFVMEKGVTGIESTPADYYWINAATDIAQ